MRQWVLGLTLAVVCLFGPVGPASAATHVVTVRNFEFSPKNLLIQKGDTVRWEWESGSHTTTNGTGPIDPNAGTLWNSPIESTTPSFEFTFTQIGDFPYYCIPHFLAGMTGLVTVEEGTAVGPITWSGIKRIFDNTAPGTKLPR